MDARKKVVDMLERAKRRRMSGEELEAQRRSFAYGNSKIENERITRETIRQEAEGLAERHEPKTRQRARKQTN